MPFPIQTVFNVLPEYQTHSGIAELVMEILVLEERLNNPEQSIYFRWGLESHRMHLAGLIRRFNEQRETFNAFDIQDFKDEIVTQEMRMIQYSKLNPRFIRYFIRGSALSKIQEMKDMINMKKIVHQLPTIEELKDMPKLLSEVLRV